MQTTFTPTQLADPGLAEANGILRTCVHCGFCTATCPTYLELGDELDSPRGRIYLIKEMLEKDQPASERVVRHIDRCLGCLACETTCPSGVDYRHLVDHAREHIEATYRRPLLDRGFRALLAWVLPSPGRFRALVRLGRIAAPFGALMPERMRAALRLLPVRGGARTDEPGTTPAAGPRRMRVALLSGCVQRTLAPEINAATIRLLSRLGCEVVIAPQAGCCGALVHHLGRRAESEDAARRNIAAWEALGDVDAIVANASGCGTMVKDYGHLLAGDPQWDARARRIAALARDVSEVVADLGLPAPTRTVPRLVVAYHSACSLQHGQKITTLPKGLLAAAGFDVRDVPEGHICCGSAGTYNILQPEIAGRLAARKARNIERVAPDVIAAGNIGCMVQIAGASPRPVVHTVALLDWATGGPRPTALG
ncbi:MAG: glycolate oxidase subunit GlcF [Alphaproteobacteria bacterium]|nr:glycolate oxidase subunit GlcF [Alphaproteobacteria bacterium]